LCIDEFVCIDDNRSLKTFQPLLRYYTLGPTQTWNSCSRMLQAVDCLWIGRTKPGIKHRQQRLLAWKVGAHPSWRIFAG